MLHQEGLKKALQSLGSFLKSSVSSCSYRVQVLSKMFQLVLIEGKGEGLVTTADIPAGTLLVSEPPALRVTLMGGDLSPMAGVDVSRQFCRLGVVHFI